MSMHIKNVETDFDVHEAHTHAMKWLHRFYICFISSPHTRKTMTFALYVRLLRYGKAITICRFLVATTSNQCVKVVRWTRTANGTSHTTHLLDFFFPTAAI